MPASVAPTDPEARQGKLEFESECLACHSVGQGKKLGPDVLGVTKRRDGRVARAVAEVAGEDARLRPRPRRRCSRSHKVPMPNQTCRMPRCGSTSSTSNGPTPSRRAPCPSSGAGH